MNTDCIYFEDTYKDDPEYRSCLYSRGLYKKVRDDDEMCKFCRLWDAYIPKLSTRTEIEKAQKWQNMSLEEQLNNPYEEYF